MTGDKLHTDPFCHVTWNGEAEPAIHAIDQSVHSNHLAIDVTQRAAAVARIDRRIGLQVVGNGVAAGLEQFAAAFAADHSVSESVVELERCTDRECKLAYAHGIAVA